ncbi:hypothetical protein D3C86_1913110 [compost metagenome]
MGAEEADTSPGAGAGLRNGRRAGVFRTLAASGYPSGGVLCAGGCPGPYGCCVRGCAGAEGQNPPPDDADPRGRIFDQ